MTFRDPNEPTCSYFELCRRQSVDAAAKAEREAAANYAKNEPEVTVEPIQTRSFPDWAVRGWRAAGPKGPVGPQGPDVNGPNPKDLAGRSKPDLSLVSGTMLAHVAAALQDGLDKYGLANWRQIAVQARTYSAASSRHVKLWEDGEDFAPDSGVHHLAHAAATLLIILDALACGSLIDNRAAPGKSAETMAALMRRRVEKLKGAETSPAGVMKLPHPAQQLAVDAFKREMQAAGERVGQCMSKGECDSPKACHAAQRCTRVGPRRVSCGCDDCTRVRGAGAPLLLAPGESNPCARRGASK